MKYLFQVDYAPIEEEDYLTEDALYPSDYISSNFVGSIADSVEAMDEEDEKTCLDNLKDALEIRGGIEVDTENRTITITDKDRFYKVKYDALMEYIKDASELSLDQYSLSKRVLFTDNDKEIRDFTFVDIRNEIERLTFGDKWGIYLCSDDDGYDTVDDFIRYLDNGTTLYIGQVFRYHN